MSGKQSLHIADFGPYTQQDQAPDDRVGTTPPPVSQMEAEIDFVADTNFANTIRLYTLHDQQASLIDHAIQHNDLNVIPSIFLPNPNGPPSDSAAVMTELNNLVSTLENLPSGDLAKIPFVVIGSEEITEVKGWSDKDIEAAIEYVKGQLPNTVSSQLKFTTAETYDGQYMYLRNNGDGTDSVDFSYDPAHAQYYAATDMGLSADIDVIFANVNAYWDGVSIAHAADHVDQIYQKLVDLYPGKDVVISETGWPSDGATQYSGIFTSPQQSAVPNLANEQTYWHDFLPIAYQQNISFGAFEAFNEPNKDGSDPASVENNWGLIATNSGTEYTGSTFKTSIMSLEPASAPPSVVSVVASPAAGDVMTGSEVTLTLTMSGAVTVSGGIPDLMLNDGGIATYNAARSTSSALAFDYSVEAGQSTTELAVTGLDLNGAMIQNASGQNWYFAAVFTGFPNLRINPATLVTLTIFDGTNGAGPDDLLIDAQGDLFGTTYAGGNGNPGTAFEVTKTDTGTGTDYATSPNALASAANGLGLFPFGGLQMDTRGDLFGITNEGGENGFQGDGTVFELVPDSNAPTGYSIKTLFDFSSSDGTDGARPHGGLLIDADGDLFGTTSTGGGATSDGTVFELKPDAVAGTGYSLSDLVVFDGTNGANPFGTLISDSSGDLFGTASAGSADDDGTVFELAKVGGGAGAVAYTFVPLVSFNGANGSHPLGGLIADPSGALFGMTSGGGANNRGTIFEIPRAATPTGYASTPVTLADFNGDDGANGPYSYGGLIVDTIGDLFGMTRYGNPSNLGTVFELKSDPATSTGYAASPTILVNFNGDNGASPEGGLIADTSGNLFGSTRYGGGTQDAGTVFELMNSGFQGSILTWTGAIGRSFGVPGNWTDLTNRQHPAPASPHAADTVLFNTTAGEISGSGTVAIIDVGSTGAGVPEASAGAVLVANSMNVAMTDGSVGQIGLTGTGTSLEVSGAAIVADRGTGVLSVLGGATFAAGSLTIGAQASSSGAAVVSGIGSVINLTGALNIGTALGTGDLTVGPGAAVHASVVNLQGQVVLEGGLLDPTVSVINQGQTAGGFGTLAADDIIDEGVIQAGGPKPSQRLLLVQGTIVGGGTLTKNGTVQPSSPAGLLQINAGGTMELTGAVLNAATTFQDALTPTGTYTITNSVVDVSFADAAGVLLLDDIAGFGGTITTFKAGDQFVIAGGTLSGVSVSNGNTLTFSDSGPNAGAGGIDRIIFGSPVNAGQFNIAGGNTVQAVACFAAGTRIGVEDRSVAVEDLRDGDRVVTADGRITPVVWIGSRTVDCRRHPRPETVWPVRVRAGAFGRNVPVRDLYLSPDHAVLVGDVLVPVKLLINGSGIAQVKRTKVAYYHVELERHEVILAEGLAVESYLDLGDRANFKNVAGAIRLFPDFSALITPETALVWETRGAAPFVTTGQELTTAVATVAANAPCRDLSSVRRVSTFSDNPSPVQPSDGTSTQRRSRLL